MSECPTRDEHDQPEEAGETRLPLTGQQRPRRRRTVKEPSPRPMTSATDRLLLLDILMRSKLPVSEFSRLVGRSAHTIYTWKRRFEEEGPAGLEMQKKGRPGGSRVPEPTRRAILMMKEQHAGLGRGPSARHAPADGGLQRESGRHPAGPCGGGLRGRGGAD